MCLTKRQGQEAVSSWGRPVRINGSTSGGRCFSSPAGNGLMQLAAIGRPDRL